MRAKAFKNYLHVLRFRNEKWTKVLTFVHSFFQQARRRGYSTPPPWALDSLSLRSLLPRVRDGYVRRYGKWEVTLEKTGL